MVASKKNANLLIEIGCEELPPTDLKKLAVHFAKNFTDALHAAEVIDDAKNFNVFATPRRLAVLVGKVANKAPSRVVDARGPSVSSAFDENGKPTKAALGFAKSNGVAVEKLTTVKTDKGKYLSHSKKVTGKKIADIVTETLADVIRTLPVAKKMRWGTGDAEFVRPVHWLLALHGNKLVKTEAFGIKATGFTYGHRFHAPAKFKIANADVYEAALSKKGMVVADFGKRRAMIEKQLEKIADKVNAKVVVDDALLDVVTGMVEYPHAVMGNFDKRFLKLPAEVLIACMRTHQKYFHLTSAKGKLLPTFITIANIKSKSDVHIKSGNERVVRARLSDAEFFYQSDLETPLTERVDKLKNLLFHKRLGSVHDKTVRVKRLAIFIAKKLQADEKMTGRAALLCKADFVTDMVGEFPELQGVIGCDYAKKYGEPKAVADAIAEHYLPRYAGDKLPHSAVAQSVALADRLDSLVGLFAAGEIPSGDRDPFALRRAALGVSRILIEKELDLNVYELLEFAEKGYTSETSNTAMLGTIFYFLQERLRSYYQARGYSIAEFKAVLDAKPKSPLDFDRRIKALQKFFTTHRKSAKSLATANKRIAGILKRFKDIDVPTFHNDKLLKNQSEKKFAEALDEVVPVAQEYFDNNHYDEGLIALSTLKQPVDEFFDNVMVMDDNIDIRNNRLALLKDIRTLFLSVADISLMSTDK